MIKILITCFVVVYSTYSVAQEVKVEISNLTISGHIEETSNIVSITEKQGPYFEITGNILNNTSESIIIYPSKASYYLTYNYDFKIFKKQLFPLAFMDHERIEILPGQTVKFEVDVLIFSGTPIYYTQKENYTLDLIKILPTMEMTFKDQDYFLTTKGAKQVVIK